MSISALAGGRMGRVSFTMVVVAMPLGNVVAVVSERLALIP